jgi:hypothetical protein
VLDLVKDRNFKEPALHSFQCNGPGRRVSFFSFASQSPAGPAVDRPHVMSLKTLAIIAVLILPFAGCAGQRTETSSVEQKLPPPPTTLPADGVIDRGLVAEYYGGDGLGYNLALSLRVDGTFSCKWTGCLGDYGNASGVWSRSADRVSFVSREATGMLENYLRGATVVDGGEFPALVLDQERDFYEQHGLSRYSALQRTSRLSN